MDDKYLCAYSIKGISAFGIIVLNVNRRIGRSRRASFAFAIFIDMLTKAYLLLLAHLKDSGSLKYKSNVNICRGFIYNYDSGETRRRKSNDRNVCMTDKRSRESLISSRTKRKTSLGVVS